MERAILCGAFSTPPPSQLSTVYQCDGCLSSWGHGGSWLGCQVLPAIGAVSILKLAANSGSSRMPQAPNLHLAMQLLLIELKVISKHGFCRLKFYAESIANQRQKNHDHKQFPVFVPVAGFCFFWMTHLITFVSTEQLK